MICSNSAVIKASFWGLFAGDWSTRLPAPLRRGRLEAIIRAKILWVVPPFSMGIRAEAVSGLKPRATNFWISW